MAESDFLEKNCSVNHIILFYAASVMGKCTTGTDNMSSTTLKCPLYSKDLNLRAICLVLLQELAK